MSILQYNPESTQHYTVKASTRRYVAMVWNAQNAFVNEFKPPPQLPITINGKEWKEEKK